MPQGPALPHHEDLISEIKPPGTAITQTGAYNPVVVKSSRHTNAAEIFLKNTEPVLSTFGLINIILTRSVLLPVSKQ